MNKYQKVKSSDAEKDIIQHLLDLGFSFYIEKSFEDCINPKTSQKLRFDFYIPKLNLCIEYDGRQHFEKVSDFKTQSYNLSSQKEKDSLKSEYCQLKEIHLLRISYKDKMRLKEIINNYLKVIG